MTGPSLTPDERVAATLAFLRDVLGLQVSNWQAVAVDRLVRPLRPPARPVPPPGEAVHLPSDGVHYGGANHQTLHGGTKADCPACQPDFHEGPREAIHGGARAGCPDCPTGDPADTSPEQERAARLHADPMDDAPTSEWRARHPLPTPDRATVESLLQDPRAVREALAELYEPRRPIPDGQTWSAVPTRPGAMSTRVGDRQGVFDPLYCPGCGLASGPRGQRPQCDTCTHPWHGQR